MGSFGVGEDGIVSKWKGLISDRNTLGGKQNR